MPFIIAIDGPAGAGKSTVARRIAKELGFTYLDTGAMYRSVALKVLVNGIDPQDAGRLEETARNSTIAFSPLQPDGGQQVFLDGLDVTHAIRTPEVTSLTSRISTVPSLRAIVVDQQRRIAASDPLGVVLEGRDIGTVVFPHAQLKVFLTASPEERARRRVEEMRARGFDAHPGQTLTEILDRDERDSSRTTSPLTRAADAVALNTDSLTIDAVVEQIASLWREKAERQQ